MEINEDDLVMYEESLEIKETIWKLWDIINDKEIIIKILLNTSFLKYLKEAKSQSNISISDSKEKDKDKDTINESTNSNKLETNGK
jgi:hypothetical protein